MTTQDAESIGDILARRLRQSGLAEPVRAAQICAIADAVSDGRWQAVCFRDGTLTIRASNAIAAHELRLVREQLVTELKKRFGWSENQTLRIRVVV